MLVDVNSLSDGLIKRAKLGLTQLFFNKGKLTSLSLVQVVK